MANGLDVYSAYQTVTDWSRVRNASYEFVYIKLSDGTAVRNEAGYTAGAKRAGLKAGGYHYAEPGDAVAQANLFVNLCELHGATDLAPALDLEAPFTPNQTAINFAIAFLRQVKARGHRPCLYANNSMLKTVRGPVLAAVPETLIWVARYGANPTIGYNFWQWSSSGSVPGISAKSVDLNKGSIPLNSNTSQAVAPAPPSPFSGDDEMFLACKGFDPSKPDAVLYALYSGGVLTALDADSVKNGLLPSYYKDKIVWVTAARMQELAAKSAKVVGA